MDHAQRMARFDQTDLYVVITESFCAGRPALDILRAVLEAGVGIVQLREKELDDRVLFDRCLAFRDLTRRADALLIIDDRVDIALAGGADGVHLGEHDLPVAEARNIAPDLIIGASAHNPEEALAAQAAGASYVNIGPIFPTQTKAVPTGDVGPGMIDAVAPHLHVPFSCMGGIKAHNLGPVLERGARHVAVVTAVTAAADPKAAAAELRNIIQAKRVILA